MRGRPRARPDAVLKEPEVLADSLIERGRIATIPVDLDRICALWPTLTITVEDIEKPGYLIDLGRLGGEIFVRSGDSPERQRFTIAHELGHWVLGRELKVQVDAIDRVSVERWCDSFAAALLLKKDWLSRYIQSHDIEQLWTRVASGAMKFRVSETAFRIRVAQVTPISIFDVETREGQIRFSGRFISSVLRPAAVRDILQAVRRGVVRPRFTERLKGPHEYWVIGKRVDGRGDRGRFLACAAPTAFLGSTAPPDETPRRERQLEA